MQRYFTWCSSATRSANAMALALMALAVMALPAQAQYAGDSRYGRDDGYSRDYGGNQESDDDEYEDGQDAPDVSYFHDQLSDDGTWYEDPEYGEVWAPRGVDSEWRPYTRGSWANTDEYGWYWVSDEPFGWATYHYGRWHLSPRWGWVWVPGTRWGPAWVAWRSSDEYVGWAPLPPEAYWDRGAGLRYDAAIYESPRFSLYWSFVAPTYVTTPGLYRYCAPRNDVTKIIIKTRPNTDYIIVNKRIVNRGVPVVAIEKVTKKTIVKVKVSASDNVSLRGVDKHNGGVVNVYRPKLTHAEKLERKAGSPAFNKALFKDVDSKGGRGDKAGNPPPAAGAAVPDANDKKAWKKQFRDDDGKGGNAAAVPENRNSQDPSLQEYKAWKKQHRDDGGPGLTDEERAQRKADRKARKLEAQGSGQLPPGGGGNQPPNAFKQGNPPGQGGGQQGGQGGQGDPNNANQKDKKHKKKDRDNDGQQGGQ